jgi:hypothetical protein
MPKSAAPARELQALAMGAYAALPAPGGVGLVRPGSRDWSRVGLAWAGLAWAGLGVGLAWALSRALVGGAGSGGPGLGSEWDWPGL